MLSGENDLSNVQLEMKCKCRTPSDLAVFVCSSGSRPEGELQVSHDLHPGAKGSLPRHTAAGLSGIPTSLAQQQPRQVLHTH